MHGLIFETSIWLLAGSTRFYQKSSRRSNFLQSPTCSTFISNRVRYHSKLSDIHLKAKIWIRSSDVEQNPYSTISTHQEWTELVNHAPTLRRKIYQAVLDCYAKSNTPSVQIQTPKKFFRIARAGRNLLQPILRHFWHLVFAACSITARIRSNHHQGNDIRLHRND